MTDRIDIYRERGLSDNIEAAFDFVRSHLASWTRMSAILLAPTVLVLATLYTMLHTDNNIMVSGPSDVIPMVWEYYPWLSLVLWLWGLWVAISLPYVFLRAHARAEAGASGPSLSEAWQLMRPVLGRTLLATLTLNLLQWFATSHFLAFVPAVAVGVPLSLLAPSLVMDGGSLADGVSRCLRLGFSTWFRLALLMGIMFLLVLAMSMAVYMPWLLFHQFFSMLVLDGIDSLPLMLSGQFLLLAATASCIYAFFFMVSVVMLACAFHYGSAVERIDHHTVDRDIEQFSQL